MRLRCLDLVRYGKFTGQQIDFGERVDGEPDLHIVYGPNESGKSTAFTGFLDLLFGIEQQSRYNFLHSYTTMRVGGSLDLSIGVRNLVRIKRPHPTLRNAADEPVSESLILGDLGGIDRNTYRTMFSLDDDTLEAGGKSILASNGRTGQLLFSASAGLSELSGTLLKLRSETDGFTRPGARSGELQDLKAALTAMKQERDTIDTLASDYNRLSTDRDRRQRTTRRHWPKRQKTKACQKKIQQLLTALPRITALHKLRERHEAFANVPDAPPEWLAELPELQRSENRHRSETELIEAEIKRLSDELTAIVVDERALRLVDRLDRLTELRARYVTADLDLPNRRREIATVNGEVSSILMRLGRQTEPDPARLLLNASQSAALNSLIVSRSGVEEKVSAATDELSKANLDLTEAKRALQEDPGSAHAPPLAPLSSALAAFRDSDYAIRLRNSTRNRTLQTELQADQLAALLPWNGTADELARLDVPDDRSIKTWSEEVVRNDALVVQRQDALEQIETESALQVTNRDAVRQAAGLLTDQEAAAIRAAREAAWAEHRRTLDHASADTFESALRRDDAANSARLGHERDLARLHEAESALAVLRGKAQRARTLLNEATAKHQDQIAGTTAAISKIAPELSDVSPDWLLSWIQRRAKALENRDLLRQADREIRDAQADASALRDRLTNALGQAGVIFDPLAELESLMATAQSIIDHEAHTATLRKAVGDCEREVRKRELAVQKASLADTTWLANWQAACSACWLGEEAAALPYETVREMVVATTDLRQALKSQTDLATRIGSMEADQAAFGTELERLASELGIDTKEHSRIELAQILTDQVQEASRVADRKHQLQTSLIEAEGKQLKIRDDALTHTRRAGEMMGFMQTDSLIELAGKLQDAAQKADLKQQAMQAERDILAALHVDNLSDAQTLLDNQSESELELEQTKLASQLEGLEGRTRELFVASRKAADQVAAVGGDDAVAAIEERRQTKLLTIEEKALNYLRLRVGIVAAERALRAYRDQHRSSMMQHASTTFTAITRGAYRGLGTQPDKDGDVLVALDAKEGSKLAIDLSKGTRFQLYLALRAAGYEEFAKLRPPVPFIADDIMETFDNFRAEATLRVFEGMARLGQVIYLTHHDHLRAMAEQMIRVFASTHWPHNDNSALAPRSQRTTPLPLE